MMWKEFEEIAGYEVSFETYDKVIEPMYMALPETIDKYQFVKMLDKKAFALPTKAELKRKMRKLANVIFEACGRRSTYNEETELRMIAEQYAKRVYGLDWNADHEVYVFFNHEYEFPGMRGCSYPVELVIGKGTHEYERIALMG